MIQTKQLYEAPEAQALVVRFEGVICGSPNYGVQGAAGASQGFNEDGSDF